MDREYVFFARFNRCNMQRRKRAVVSYDTPHDADLSRTSGQPEDG